ncbi:MAG: hypothetical protein ABR508_02435, partial [Candidatus Baltobacteraceae bacterium]
MRTHRKFPLFGYPRDGQKMRDTATLAHLAAARLEPVLRGAYLDLLFCGARESVCIALIELCPAMMDQRESSPFIWPAAAAQFLDHAVVTAIEDALLPWIESLCFNRALNAEAIRFFAEEPARERFRAARERRFLGAAPYSAVFAAAAPYVYAARFSGGKRANASDPSGATGAALLAKSAACVTADLQDAQACALAAQWFGLDLYGPAAERADVSVGGAQRAALHVDLAAVNGPVVLASPVPMDITVSFDPQDAPPVRR